MATRTLLGQLCVLVSTQLHAFTSYQYLGEAFHQCFGLQGISLVSDVSGEQVEALAGGPLLQQLILNQERNARQVTPKMLARATQRLASALQQVCLITLHMRC